MTQTRTRGLEYLLTDTDPHSHDPWRSDPHPLTCVLRPRGRTRDPRATRGGTRPELTSETTGHRPGRTRDPTVPEPAGDDRTDQGPLVLTGPQRFPEVLYFDPGNNVVFVCPFRLVPVAPAVPLGTRAHLAEGSSPLGTRAHLDEAP